jgi:hypothetical protein
MKRMSTAIIASAALLCSASLSLAQDNRPGGPGGGPGGASPGPGGGPGGPGGGPGSMSPGGQRGGPERAAPPSRGPGAERAPEPRANAPTRSESGRNVERSEQPSARPERDRKGAEQQRNEQRNRATERAQEKNEQRNRATERAQEKQERSQRNAEPKQPDKSQRGESRQPERSPRKAEPREQQQPDRSKTTERKGTEQQAQRHQEIRSSREKLSSEQRGRLRSSFDVRQARVTNAKFTARIGTHIPRRVRLFAVPAAVLAIVPAYAYYRYVVLDDHICIVDPDTYEVVDVIDEGPSGPGPRPQMAALDLTSSEQRLVLDSIADDFPPADVRVRLALGAEVPRSVELYPFPDPVIDRIPKLRDFNFVVAEREIVIVDPRDRGVALVIDR